MTIAGLRGYLLVFLYSSLPWLYNNEQCLIRKKNYWFNSNNVNKVSPRWRRSQAELRDTIAALRKTEEKYRSIFEEAIEGIFQTSMDGRFINANPSLARIHGYDSPRISSSPLLTFRNSFTSTPKTGAD